MQSICILIPLYFTIITDRANYDSDSERPLPVVIPVASIYHEHINSIPVSNRHRLNEKLDFDNEDLDTHLEKIADSMINWKVSLATPLGLSEREVHVIGSDNQNQTILQQ